MYLTPNYGMRLFPQNAAISISQEMHRKRVYYNPTVQLHLMSSICFTLFKTFRAYKNYDAKTKILK